MQLFEQYSKKKVRKQLQNFSWWHTLAAYRDAAGLEMWQMHLQTAQVETGTTSSKRKSENILPPEKRVVRLVVYNDQIWMLTPVGHVCM